MRVIVIGAGKVGYQIVESLSRERYDVIVIEKVKEVVDKINDTLDVMAITSNGLASQSLKEIGVNSDDIVIAVTDSDEGNMIACVLAKQLGAGKTIARVRNPEYTKDLDPAKKTMSLDYVINPERSTAYEITRMLTFSPAGQIGEFAEGRVQMVEVPVEEDGPLSNIAVKNSLQFGSILIAAISRKGAIIIPRGDDLILPGDNLFITGTRSDVAKFCRSVGKNPVRVKDAMIVGGGRISYYLAQSLHDHGISVKIIENDPAICKSLSEELPNALIINGDGTDATLLKAEGITSMDAFIALTGRDEDNILISLLAKTLGAQKAIAKVSRPNYISLADTIGIDASVTPSIITSSEILRFTHGGKIMSLFLLLGGQAEIMEFLVHSSSIAVGKQLKDLAIPKESIVTTIVRGSKVIVPRGNTVVQTNDRLIVISSSAEVVNVEKLFGTKRRNYSNGLWRRIKSLRALIAG